MHSPEDVPRRNLLIRAIYGMGALITAALVGPAVAYLFVPSKASSKNGWVDAGDVTRLQPNVPEEMIFHRNRVDGWKVVSEKSTAWVVKTADNHVTAFAPQCTHLGCAYHWDEQSKNFLCPCHTSSFGIDGKVLAGPAPRPLDRYQVKVEGTIVKLGAIEKSQA